MFILCQRMVESCSKVVLGDLLSVLRLDVPALDGQPSLFKVVDS